MDSKMENLTLTYLGNKNINQRGVYTPLTKQIKMETIKVTRKEEKVLRAIEDSTFSDEGNGLCGYLYEDEFDLKKYRGVLSSLVKKGIIGVERMEDNDETSTWVWIKNEFVTTDSIGLDSLDDNKIQFNN